MLLLVDVVKDFFRVPKNLNSPTLVPTDRLDEPNVLRAVFVRHTLVLTAPQR